MISQKPCKKILFLFDLLIFTLHPGSPSCSGKVDYGNPQLGGAKERRCFHCYCKAKMFKKCLNFSICFTIWIGSLSENTPPHQIIFFCNQKKKWHFPSGTWWSWLSPAFFYCNFQLPFILGKDSRVVSHCLLHISEFRVSFS